MKKNILLSVLGLFNFYSAFSQAGEWVWLKGDILVNQPANFGVQGVPAITNNPFGLYEACEWKDLNGNFWMFGGYGGSPSSGRTNDLWKYEPSSNMWTWMKGPGVINDAGNYGVQGISAPTNNPPSRSHGMASWVDTSGNLWMFGGAASGLYSDLWKYDISTNEWVWMKGPNTLGDAGTYGTIGVADPANNPACRRETSIGWTDNQNNLWLFGGYSNSGSMNDLCKYSIANNTWTWMKGLATAGQLGIYGVMGIEDPANTPGSRMAYSRWKDANGNFWLLGGGSYLTGDYNNDLWRFNPLTNNWAWINGSNTSNNLGNYTLTCDTLLTNFPKSRFENRVSVTDQNGNFWMFGGARDGSITSVLNDLWTYCPLTNKWMWVSGVGTIAPPGNWGVQGVSSPNNMPNGRGGAVGWSDNNGHIYFFGGAETNVSSQHNDLWKFTIDSACNLCVNTTSMPENSLGYDLVIVPNPAHSVITLALLSSINQNIELRIFNSLGDLVYASNEKTRSQKFEKEISIESFSQGIYFIHIITKDGIVLKKFIKE